MRGNMHQNFNGFNLAELGHQICIVKFIRRPCRLFIGMCMMILGIAGFVCPAFAVVIDGWDVELVEPLKYEQELKHTREVQIYTGDYIMQESYNHPQEGMKFVLAHVSVQKKEAGGASFNPNLFILKSGDKTYERVNDDAFLVDFSMKSLPHLNMRYGAYDAWLIYEIPVTVDKAVLTYGKLDLQAVHN